MNISEIVTALEELAKHAKDTANGEQGTADAILEEASKKEPPVQ
jgi:hypothetical protein